jgi:hypothetical protein
MCKTKWNGVRLSLNGRAVVRQTTDGGSSPSDSTHCVGASSIGRALRCERRRYRFKSDASTHTNDPVAEEQGRWLQPTARRCESCRGLYGGLPEKEWAPLLMVGRRGSDAGVQFAHPPPLWKDQPIGVGRRLENGRAQAVEVRLLFLPPYVSRFTFRCRGVAQPGRALALGASSRRFKSYRLDQPGRTSRWATAPAWKPGGASCRGSTPLPSAIIGRTSRCDDGTRFENG